MAKSKLHRELAAKDDTRRARILSALYGLICEQGYARTSLANLAATAEMSPSHLLYYFDSKDAVLEDLFEYCSQRMVRDILALPGETPAEQCEALVDYFFGGKILTARDQSFLLEVFGVAAHDPRLRRLKSNYDGQIKAYFAALFRRTPRLAGLSAEDAAEIAFATASGLVTGAYFNDGLAPPRGGALFRAVLRHLAGYDAESRSGAVQSRPSPRPTASSVRRKPSRIGGAASVTKTDR